MEYRWSIYGGMTEKEGEKCYVVVSKQNGALSVV